MISEIIKYDGTAEAQDKIRALVALANSFYEHRHFEAHFYDATENDQTVYGITTHITEDEEEDDYWSQGSSINTYIYLDIDKGSFNMMYEESVRYKEIMRQKQHFNL